MSNYYIPEDTAFAEQYQQHAQKEAALAENRGSNFRFLDFLGPNGGKWKTAHTGFESRLNIMILPPSLAQAQKGVMHFITRRSHFYFSDQYPNGTSEICNGKSSCYICQGRNLLFESTIQADNERAKSNGRPKEGFLYQVFNLDDVEGHLTEDGKYKPFLFEAGWTLHNQIMKLCNEHKLSTFINPDNARPFILTKKKTGPDRMKVEYMASPSLHSLPLPKKEILDNLYDLTVLDKKATIEQQMGCLKSLRFPIPQGMEQALQQEQAQEQAQAQRESPQTVATYNPNPNPPQQAQYVQQPVVQQPVVQQQQQQYAAQQQPQAQQHPYTPQVYEQPQAAQPQTTQVVIQPSAQVQYAPTTGVSQLYQPQVQQQAPQPQVQQQVQQVTPPQVTQSVQSYTQEGTVLTLPLAPSVSLPEGRHRCFGKFAESDQMCAACPSWIKGQCVPQSTASDLDQLQHQMMA